MAGFTRILPTGHEPRAGEPQPLSLFTAARVDYSLQRLRHYTGTSPDWFQNFVLFTSYQFYIDEFVRLGHESMANPNSEYIEFVEPGNLVTRRVGSTNTKNITDHIAVLRPHAWIMLGHSAGLRNSQQLGDYVLAHGYVREDNVLDEDLPLWVPIPALAEIQQALEQAVQDVKHAEGLDLKRIMRTGTVASTDNLPRAR